MRTGRIFLGAARPIRLIEIYFDWNWVSTIIIIDTKFKNHENKIQVRKFGEKPRKKFTKFYDNLTSNSDFSRRHCIFLGMISARIWPFQPAGHISSWNRKRQKNEQEKFNFRNWKIKFNIKIGKIGRSDKWRTKNSLKLFGLKEFSYFPIFGAPIHVYFEVVSELYIIILDLFSIILIRKILSWTFINLLDFLLHY